MAPAKIDKIKSFNICRIFHFIAIFDILTVSFNKFWISCIGINDECSRNVRHEGVGPLSWISVVN